MILYVPFFLVKSLIKDKSEGTGPSVDLDRFGRVKVVTHVMWGTDQAEARQLFSSSKQQPAKQAAREREIGEREKGRGRKNGRKRE